MLMPLLVQTLSTTCKQEKPKTSQTNCNIFLLTIIFIMKTIWDDVQKQGPSKLEWVEGSPDLGGSDTKYSMI